MPSLFISFRRYQGDWDATRPDNLSLYLSKAHTAIIWGGNHFSDQLPQCNKWLVWNKEQTMPSYSDCELAWTNLNGNAIKMFTYAGNGFFAREKERWHPTQKPIALMNWCLDVAHMEEGWTIGARESFSIALSILPLSRRLNSHLISAVL